MTRRARQPWTCEVSRGQRTQMACTMRNHQFWYFELVIRINVGQILILYQQEKRDCNITSACVRQLLHNAKTLKPVMLVAANERKSRAQRGISSFDTWDIFFSSTVKIDAKIMESDRSQLFIKRSSSCIQIYNENAQVVIYLTIYIMK